MDDSTIDNKKKKIATKKTKHFGLALKDEYRVKVGRAAHIHMYPANEAPSANLGTDRSEKTFIRDGEIWLVKSWIDEGAEPSNLVPPDERMTTHTAKGVLSQAFRGKARATAGSDDNLKVEGSPVVRTDDPTDQNCDPDGKKNASGTVKESNGTKDLAEDEAYLRGLCKIEDLTGFCKHGARGLGYPPGKSPSDEKKRPYYLEVILDDVITLGGSTSSAVDGLKDYACDKHPAPIKWVVTQTAKNLDSKPETIVAPVINIQPKVPSTPWLQTIAKGTSGEDIDSYNQWETSIVPRPPSGKNVSDLEALADEFGRIFNDEAKVPPPAPDPRKNVSDLEQASREMGKLGEEMGEDVSKSITQGALQVGKYAYALGEAAYQYITWTPVVIRAPVHSCAGNIEAEILAYPGDPITFNLLTSDVLGVFFEFADIFEKFGDEFSLWGLTVKCKFFQDAVAAVRVQYVELTNTAIQAASAASTSESTAASRPKVDKQPYAASGERFHALDKERQALRERYDEIEKLVNTKPTLGSVFSGSKQDLHAREQALRDYARLRELEALLANSPEDVQQQAELIASIERLRENLAQYEKEQKEHDDFVAGKMDDYDHHFESQEFYEADLERYKYFRDQEIAIAKEAGRPADTALMDKRIAFLEGKLAEMAEIRRKRDAEIAAGPPDRTEAVAGTTELIAKKSVQLWKTNGKFVIDKQAPVEGLSASHVKKHWTAVLQFAPLASFLVKQKLTAWSFFAGPLGPAVDKFFEKTKLGPTAGVFLYVEGGANVSIALDWSALNHSYLDGTTEFFLGAAVGFYVQLFIFQLNVQFGVEGSLKVTEMGTGAPKSQVKEFAADKMPIAHLGYNVNVTTALKANFEVDAWGWWRLTEQLVDYKVERLCFEDGSEANPLYKSFGPFSGSEAEDPAVTKARNDKREADFNRQAEAAARARAKRAEAEARRQARG